MKKNALLILIFFFIFSTPFYSQNKDGLWSLVMTKIENNGQQRWKTRYEFPEAEIKSDWNDGYEITQLSYLNDVWTLITAKNSFYEQSWRTKNSVDNALEAINELKVAGKMITSLEYGKNQWVIVASKGTDFSTQEAKKHYLDFPYEYMQNKISQGYFLSDIGFDGTYWLTIFSKDNYTSSQFYFTSQTFPESEIKNYWNKEYRISKLKFLNNKWYVFMIKNTKYGQQAWRTRYEFPKNEITELWGQGFSISSIHFNPTAKQIPVVNESLVGSWRAPDTDDVIIFGNDNFLKLEYWEYDPLEDMDYKVILGGKGYTDQYGTPIDFKYEVKSNDNPKSFDMVISVEGKEYQRLTYLYKFENSKLIIKAPREGVTKKTYDFNEEDGFDITVYERI